MPVFLALAVISYVQPSPICTIPGPYGYLTSMWFMYLVMAVTHSAAWLPLIDRLLSKAPKSALPPLDCCVPAVQDKPEPRAQAPRLVQSRY